MAYPAIVSYSWVFGDGDTSNQQNPEHEYSEGTYIGSLTIQNSVGATATRYFMVKAYKAYGGVQYSWVLGDGAVSDRRQFGHTYLNNGVFVATLNGADSHGRAGTQTALIKVVGGRVKSWIWSFGDGGTGTGKTPQWVYLPGVYTVRGIAKDYYGNTAEVVKPDMITVGGVRVNVNPNRGNSPLSVKFSIGG